MNLLKRNKSLFLFLILFLHMSLLDLFYVTTSGPVFMWQENMQTKTIFVHILIALLSVALYAILVNAQKIAKSRYIRVGDKFWLASSMVLVVSIGYLLLV